MIKISFLGVEGYPQGGRETISILLETGKYRMLLDCGASIIQQLDRCNLMASNIDAVFVSHLHVDHSSGLPLLLYSSLMEHFEKRAQGIHEISILGNQSILEPLLGYCRAAYPAIFTGKGLVVAHQVHIDAKTPFLMDNNIKIDTTPMSHAVEGLSLAIAINGIRICYSADTRKTDALIKLAKDSNLLICNVFGCDEKAAESSGFMSAVGAAELARESGAGRLVMLHLNDDSSRKAAVSTAQKYFSGIIEAPQSGTNILI